ADPPDELRRDVDLERLALPARERLMGLHRVVQDGLRAVFGLDEHVRLREASVDGAALVAAWLVHERLLPDGLLGVEQRLELFPFDLDQPDRPAGLVRAVVPRPRHTRSP